MDPRRTFTAGTPPVTVYDYGGEGPDVLLLHGGARSSSDWETIAGLLAGGGFRALAMDLRGHGASGEADWSWDGALDDVRAVVEKAGLDRPILIGHSLGGMIAALWAGQHPECPLAVNIDGHGNPCRADRLLGLDGAAADEALASLRAQLADLGSGLSPWMLDVMRQIDGLDLPAIYRATRCPLLVVSGTTTDEFALLFDEPGATAWTAARDWLTDTLARMADDVPLFDHDFLDGGHDAHREDPVGLFRLVRSRLARASRTQSVH